MIPDVRIRQVLDTITPYTFKITLSGPFHKTYDKDGLTILSEALTGTKIVTVRREIDEVRDSYEKEAVLVTPEEVRGYEAKRKEDSKKRESLPLKQLAEYYAEPLRRRNRGEEYTTYLSGPIVESLNDTNLETAKFQRILVRYNGVNLNSEYFDAPWWQSLIRQATEQYDVEVDDVKKGVPRDSFEETRRGGVIPPGWDHHRPRVAYVFRLEATEEDNAEKAIRNVWEAGQAIQRALKGEEERLMAYLR